MVRDWLESTNLHTIQALFGDEILILEEILILFFSEVMCHSLKCSNCYLVAPDNRQVLGPLSFGQPSIGLVSPTSFLKLLF